MKIQIKSIFGKLLFECDAENIGAALVEAIKQRANLTGADLVRANLARANLIGADLAGADLVRANLARANLIGANLTRANLIGANLTGADLIKANLARANLIGANLTGADLTGADLTEAKSIPKITIAQTRILAEGDIIGWKKCQHNVIVKLKIPLIAKRSSAFGRKCRAEFVEVLEVFGSEVGISNHDEKTEYRKGTTVRCDKWCDDFTQECAGGIHFFITRLEAEQY